MNENGGIPVHPVQRPSYPPSAKAVCPQVVTKAAYEVYCRCYGDQPAMMQDGCRGGFSAGELIAFLYARSFPKAEWRERVEEALTGMRWL